MDGEGCLVDGSPFTTCAFFKNHGVNLHMDLDDDDMCFIIWLREGTSSNMGWNESKVDRKDIFSTKIHNQIQNKKWWHFHVLCGWSFTLHNEESKWQPIWCSVLSKDLCVQVFDEFERAIMLGDCL